MTTADAINTLACKLALDAVKAAEQHDYVIACNSKWCYQASKLYVLELTNNQPDCEQDLLDRLEVTGTVPDLPQVNTTEDCVVTIRDITPQISCEPISIQEQ